MHHKSSVWSQNLRKEKVTKNIPRNISEPMMSDTLIDQLKLMGYSHQEFDNLMSALGKIEKLMRDKSQNGQGAGAHIERYCGIRDTSEFGKDCQYAKKAAQLFIASGLLPQVLEALEKVSNVRKNTGDHK